MFAKWVVLLRAAIVCLLMLSVVTGVLYPLLVTALAQLAFPWQAQGSLIEKSGRVFGSRLLGQSFDGDAYFWGRLSATSPAPYNAGASGGSNLGPTNPALADAAAARIEALRSADPNKMDPVPVDLVTSSASGLDPHISPAAAIYQADRVARTRGLDRAQVLALIAQYTETPTWGLLGEPRVQVLALNLALDDLAGR